MAFVLSTGKPHVSYSEASVWMKCSWRHKLKYVDKHDLDRYGIETILGTAFHACVEAKVKGEEPDVLAVRQRIADDVDKVRATDPLAADNFSVDECLARALQMSAEAIEFLDKQFVSWQLVTAEEQLYEPLTLGEGLLSHPDVSFKGFIDLVLEATDKRGKKVVWIIDWKTASRPWDKRKLSDPTVTYQLSMYKNFWTNKHNVDPKDVKCAYIVALKKGKPGSTFKLIPVSVGPVTSQRTLTVLNNFVGSVKRGMAIKNKSEKNCQWCEYRGTMHCP